MIENPLRIFLVFLRLGLTSFGGPVAHLGYFREEFVTRRQWLGERSYADLVALCQLLPGPASSQAGMAIGYLRGGYAGSLAAWLGFTLPSALLMIGLGEGISHGGAAIPPGLLHGLKIVAVAVVAQAVWNMASGLCRGLLRTTLMTATACSMLLAGSTFTQLTVMLLAGLAGGLMLAPAAHASQELLPPVPRRRTGLMWLMLFLLLLVGLPMWAAHSGSTEAAQAAAFYRSGALVFGGGHVVLPLLQTALVPSGWIDNAAFLAGYGAAQALPGPLFAFSAYLGTVLHSGYHGWRGGLYCLAWLFAPSFLLVFAALPFWRMLRHQRRIAGALSGINAAVVGLLLAALYQPVWTGAIHVPADFALALLAFAALAFWKWPPWLVVITVAAAGVLTTPIV